MKNEDFDLETWKKIGFVQASKKRPLVLKSLKETPKTPKQISNDTEINITNMSILLKQLSEINLIVCINPEVKRGRMYRLTKTGEEIADKI